MKGIEKQLINAYDELADALFRHCYFRVGDREKAKDLLQETFAKTWQYLAERGKIDNLRAFLYRVATNLIIDLFRKKRPEISLEDLKERGFEIGSNADKKLRNEVAGKEALLFLRKLKPEYREVIIMRYIDDLSLKEIAEILNDTENNVSVRIHRGLKQIRELLK